MRNIRDYLWAEAPDQAIRWMATVPGRGAYLGGGTALALWQDESLDFVVDLSRAGLSGIDVRAEEVVLGATLPLQRVLEEPALDPIEPLVEGIRWTRTDPWRRQATLAGRLLEREPGDFVTLALLALDASAGVLRPGVEEPEWLPLTRAVECCHLAAHQGARPPSGSARPGPALVTAIRFPWPQVGWRFALERVVRSALETPLVAIAAAVRADRERIDAVRLALSAGDLPRRLPKTEAAATGCKATDVARAARALVAEFAPPSDWRATSAYRRHVGGVLVERALRRALGGGRPTGGERAREGSE